MIGRLAVAKRKVQCSQRQSVEYSSAVHTQPQSPIARPHDHDQPHQWPLEAL